MSARRRRKALKWFRCWLAASSQMMQVACLISSARSDRMLSPHVQSLSKASKGRENLKSRTDRIYAVYFQKSEHTWNELLFLLGS
jgi:hypothetical protein